MNRTTVIGDLLTSKCVMVDLVVASRKQLLQELSALAAREFNLVAHDVFNVLWEREQLGSTGLGKGIAVPHGKLAGMSAVCGVFVRLLTPMPFDAADGVPVDLVFMLLSPDNVAADHLEALAVISKLLRDDDACKQLRSAADSAAAYGVLTAKR